MFCPKCGTSEQTANSYCRSCGEFLPDVDKLSRQAARSGFGGTTPEQNVKSAMFLNAIGAVFSLVTVLILYSMLFGWFDSRVLLSVAAAFSVCVLAWQISNIYIASKLRRRLKSRRTNAFEPRQNELDAQPTAAGLPAADTAGIVRPVSVTENTTELLQPVAHQRKN